MPGKRIWPETRVYRLPIEGRNLEKEIERLSSLLVKESSWKKGDELRKQIKPLQKKLALIKHKYLGKVEE